MYRITCCRCGKFRNNRKVKGSFVMEFSTLSEFVKHHVSTNFKIFYPNLENELNPKEYRIFCNKIYAIYYKRNVNRNGDAQVSTG